MPVIAVSPEGHRGHKAILLGVRPMLGIADREFE
jgi:hypothetical protein